MVRAIVILAMLMLAGCGSSPKVHYFILAAAQGPGEKEKAVTRPVTVAAVHLPPSLDRREMVRQTGPNTVDMSDQDRWAAPLDELTRRALSQDLAAILPAGSVVLPDSPAPPHMAQIIVSIARFGTDATGKVALQGSWALLEGDPPGLVLSRGIDLHGRSPVTNANGEAGAMSDLLEQLAHRIAATLADRS